MWKFRIAGLGLLIGSISLLAITIVTNWVQGTHDGVTDSGRLINGVGSASIDIMGLLFCGLAVGICIGIRRWGWAVVFGLGLAFSAIWSGYSVYAFRASEEISASTTREIKNQRIAEADQLTRDAASKTLQAAISSKYSTTRKDLFKANEEAIKSFRDADVKVVIPAAGGMNVVAERVGWRLETLQLIRSAFFSFLIIFLKMIGFPGAGFLLSYRPERESVSVPSSAKGGSGSDGDNSKPHEDRKVVDFPAKSAAPIEVQAEPEPASVNKTKQLASEPANQKRAEPPKVSVDGQVSTDAPKGKLTYEQFRETIRQNLAAGEPSSSTRALAAATGWSQSTVVREQRKVRGQERQLSRILNHADKQGMNRAYG